MRARCFMLATLISIIFVIVFALVFGTAALGFFPIIALTAGFLILLITPLIVGLTLLPLQAASVETSSKAMNMARRDPVQIVLAVVWIAFALFSFFTAVFGTYILFVIWIIWFGLSLDAIMLYIWRAAGFSDPYRLVKLHLQDGRRNFPPHRQRELCASIDALAEVSLKAMYQKSLPLSTAVVDAMETLGKEYLDCVKDAESEEAGGRVNYTLGFLLHRLQMLFNLAAEDRLEPMANQIILSTAKLTCAVAGYDTSLTSLPVHFLESFFGAAREYELKEVTVNSSIVLHEMAKSLIEDPELRDKNLRDVLFSLIEQMEKLAKETFKEDKNTPISLLTEPFQDLKSLLEEKIPEFSGSKDVIATLNRVITEFQALRGVLQSIPNIPGYSKEDESEEEPEE
jgi:hypothetical protein